MTESLPYKRRLAARAACQRAAGWCEAVHGRRGMPSLPSARAVFPCAKDIKSRRATERENKGGTAL